MSEPLPLKFEKWTRIGGIPVRSIQMGDHVFMQTKLGDGWHQITAPNGDRHTARFNHQTLTWARDWVNRQ
ncbi:MAG: hypothetical protein K8R88_01420 [Armatimonadetes bacterium]|nr:hypothetical protein [Armatimonadota bacterium]